MTGANVAGSCNCLPSPGGLMVHHMEGCPYHGQVYSSTPVELGADPWTEERVVRLLDTLATISRRLESIEYHVRVR